VSRLSDWLGSELTILEDLPDYSIVIIICLMTAVVTEVSSRQGHELLSQDKQIVNLLSLLCEASVTLANFTRMRSVFSSDTVESDGAADEAVLNKKI
jgi:hypothetical protein